MFLGSPPHPEYTFTHLQPFFPLGSFVQLRFLLQELLRKTRAKFGWKNLTHLHPPIQTTD